MSRMCKVLFVLLTTFGLMFTTVGAANAVIYRLNGSCANLPNRYTFQSAVGNETRLVSWGSRSHTTGCWRLYTAGGQTMKATIRITNKNLRTGVTNVSTKAISGVRSVAANMSTCKHRIKVETWARAGFGEEYLVVSLPVSC